MNGAFKSKLQSSKLNSSFSSFLNPGFGVVFFYPVRYNFWEVENPSVQKWPNVINAAQCW